jgi:hypothetical protein
MLEFPAMTLFIGRNNVGKTSAYAPLLLLRQSLEARSRHTALLFRGELMDFGSYQDLVTDHQTERDISFYLNLGQPEVAHYRRVDRAAALPRALDLTFSYSASARAVVQRSSVLDANDKPIVTRTLVDEGLYKVVSSLLPANSEVGRPLKEVTQLRKNLQSESPDGFFFTGVAGIRLPADWRNDDDRWKKVQRWYLAASEIFDMYQTINHHVRSTLWDISYIGPLRSSPKRSYLLSAEPPFDVGRDGQWASEVLYQSSLDSSSDVLDQTNLWLSRLGYGTLSFASDGEYFQVLVKKPGSKININLLDCGVGLSQLLPLLVQGCVMDAGDTLIAQQPEIHLNPAQQDVMTDFLIDLCCRGRRVIVETHSEHVLVRLRRRIAEGETLSSEDVALYFSDSQEGRSDLSRISIGRVGELSAKDWPTGFFNEQMDNSLKLALAQSRRRGSEG